MKKEVVLGFTINDHKHNALDGELIADIRVFSSNQLVRTDKMLCTQGAASTKVELEIEEDGTGSIFVFYYPSEQPTNAHMSTPILYDVEFKTNSIDFQLPVGRSDLVFKIVPRIQNIEIITNDKTGIVQTLSESTTLSSGEKAYAEAEGGFVFLKAKAGAEFTVGRDETKGFVDARMREGEVGRRYDVDYPAGNLLIEQTNKPD